MANTFTAATPVSPMTVAGNMRVVMGTLTMTDGAGNVATGLDYIYGGCITPQTCNTNGGGCIFNNTTNGNIYPTTCSSGDVFQVMVFGK